MWWILFFALIVIGLICTLAIPFGEKGRARRKMRKEKKQNLMDAGFGEKERRTWRGRAIRFLVGSLPQAEHRSWAAGTPPDDVKSELVLSYTDPDWPSLFIEAMPTVHTRLNSTISRKLLEERPSASDWLDLDEIKIFLEYSVYRDKLAFLLCNAISEYTYCMQNGTASSDYNVTRWAVEALLSVTVHCSSQMKIKAVVVMGGTMRILPITEDDLRMLLSSVGDPNVRNVLNDLIEMVAHFGRPLLADSSASVTPISKKRA